MCKTFLMLYFCGKLNIASDFEFMHITEEAWTHKKTITPDILNSVTLSYTNKTISGGRYGCA